MEHLYFLTIFIFKSRTSIGTVIMDFLSKRHQTGGKAFVFHPQFWRTTKHILDLENRTTAAPRPSTGFMAIVLLSAVCEEINAFGFSNGCLSEDYKSTPEEKKNLHNFKQEHHIIEQWSNSDETRAKINLYPRGDWAMTSC